MYSILTHLGTAPCFTHLTLSGYSVELESKIPAVATNHLFTVHPPPPPKPLVICKTKVKDDMAE